MFTIKLRTVVIFRPPVVGKHREMAILKRDFHHLGNEPSSLLSVHCELVSLILEITGMVFKAQTRPAHIHINYYNSSVWDYSLQQDLR